MAITYRGERFSGYNKPKRTPGKRKKFAVLAKKDLPRGHWRHLTQAEVQQLKMF